MPEPLGRGSAARAVRPSHAERRHPTLPLPGSRGKGRHRSERTYHRQRTVGRPGTDPVVFFTLQLVMFFEGIRSERQLIETTSLNLAHRWYLGYALDAELPYHPSVTCIANTPAPWVADPFTLSAGQ